MDSHKKNGQQIGPENSHPDNEPPRISQPDDSAGSDVLTPDTVNDHVHDILRAHLTGEAAERSLQRWCALSRNYPSQDALFNSIVEFTREIAKTHNLDTIAKQNIRSGMFQRLMRHRA